MGKYTVTLLYLGDERRKCREGIINTKLQKVKNQYKYTHYWSFDKGLKNKGVSGGCCSLGTIDGVNYCHPEYPQK